MLKSQRVIELGISRCGQRWLNEYQLNLKHVQRSATVHVSDVQLVVTSEPSGTGLSTGRGVKRNAYSSRIDRRVVNHVEEQQEPTALRDP